MTVRRSARSLILAVVTGAVLGTPAVGDEPASLGQRHPLLEQLNRETRSLYDDVRRSVVRVQVPPQRWVENYARKQQQNPLNKYQNLSPEVRQELERRDRRQPEGEALAQATAVPATQPPSDAIEGGGTYIVVPPARPAGPPPADPVAGGRLQEDFRPPAAAGDKAFAPNHVGVVLDDRGHVLIPMYVEREPAGDQAIRVTGADGDVVAGKFVGSDRQTNLTVIKLDKAPGKPARLGGERPADGSLVMSIAPGDASGRLVVWNGGAQEQGVVFTSGGEMAGVARFGQFLTGASCRLIADQIIRHGSVKRATLGVIITEIREDDPLRQQVPVLGARTAMRIDQVMPGSAAERAGLKPGDLLLALAGDAVSDIPSFAAAIAARSGQTELQLLREGELLRITVELQPK